MLTQEIRDRFTGDIFTPSLVGRGNTRTSSVVVTGYSEHLKEIIVLNTVGHNANIDNLLGTIKAKITTNVITIPTGAGRINLGRLADSEFEVRVKEIPNYGIKSALIINRALLRPGGRYSYFASKTVEGAVEMVGERVKAALDISVLPKWYEYIFKIGVDEAYIRLLGGVGVRAYHIDTDPTFWQSVISSGLASKSLTF